jgi:hypothetical protein
MTEATQRRSKRVSECRSIASEGEMAGLCEGLRCVAPARRSGAEERHKDTDKPEEWDACAISSGGGLCGRVFGSVMGDGVGWARAAGLADSPCATGRWEDTRGLGK